MTVLWYSFYCEEWVSSANLCRTSHRWQASNYTYEGTTKCKECDFDQQEKGSFGTGSCNYTHHFANM